MNNKTAYIIVGATILILGIYLKSTSANPAGFVNNPAIDTSQQAAAAQIDSVTAEEAKTPADKIEVVNFFGTQRCFSCLTIGKFTKKTIEEKFAGEVASGKVVFKEINVDLPENRDMAVKYQARGSSLFINAARGETEDISEDTNVWRLVNSETQFISYLENKLNTLLGK